jgi:hypothetical protein
LATAVQVLAYEIRMASLSDDKGVLKNIDDWDQPLATSDEVELFHKHLEKTMEEVKFYDPENPKQLLTREDYLTGAEWIKWRFLYSVVCCLQSIVLPTIRLEMLKQLLDYFSQVLHSRGLIKD